MHSIFAVVGFNIVTKGRSFVRYCFGKIAIGKILSFAASFKVTSYCSDCLLLLTFIYY